MIIPRPLWSEKNVQQNKIIIINKITRVIINIL